MGNPDLTHPTGTGRVIRLTVVGKPQGKGRPIVSTTRQGRAYAFTPEKTKEAEGNWQAAFLWSGEKAFPPGVPLAMTVRAYFRRHKGQVGDYCTKRPDADNLLKLVADALNGFAYGDDSQIAVATIEKRYAPPGQPEWMEVEIKEV